MAVNGVVCASVGLCAAVDREYRVLKALESSAVPVPRPLVLCQDSSVVGTQFYVMEFAAGSLSAHISAMRKRVTYRFCKQWDNAPPLHLPHNVPLLRTMGQCTTRFMFCFVDRSFWCLLAIQLASV
jgi:aminoglycoside phosphotransferase (APT) family kinase protein